MVDSLADLREVHKRALSLGATEMRPVSHGNAWSIYFKDPEGNTVEAYLDTPFHVPQPHGKPLDLAKSDEQILRETEAGLPPGSGLHADRAVQEPDGRAARRRRLNRGARPPGRRNDARRGWLARERRAPAGSCSRYC